MNKRHEQLLFRYSSALERGDFEAVADVLHDAEHDPALEQMILDMNAAYTAEQSANSNHKNSKEIPMIAALYQKRPPAYVRWQSLPLVAALAVIGLLVVMLAVQTHGANFSNIGDNGQNGTPLVVAQNNKRCQATTLSDATLLSLPGPGGIDLYALPAGTSVYVRASYSSPTWYLINSQASQGWVTSDTLDMSHCTGSQILPSLPTATPGVSSQASPTPDQFDLTWTCGARVQTKIDLAALPSLDTIYMGSLPAQTAVTVLDYNIMLGSQGIQTPWYLIKSGSIQGWTPAYLLDTSTCPPIPDLRIGVVPPDVQVQTATLQAALLATVTQMVANATRTAEYPTFTPTPAPLNGGDVAGQDNTAQSALMTRVCKATTLTRAEILSFPALPSMVKKSVAAHNIVTLGDYTLMNDAQGRGQIWYFVESDGVQGWMLASLLDTSACPAIPDVATALPPTVIPPQNDTAGIAQHPFFIYPTPDPSVLMTIVATVNAPYQPMATMIPAQNNSQDATVCSTPVPGDPQHMTLYAQPTIDAPVVTDFYTIDAAKSSLSVLQATYVAGQTWYYIEIGSYPNQPRGWVTAKAFTAVMGSCNPLSVQYIELPTPTLIPANQQGGVPAVKCPTPSNVSRITMYSRPSLDSFKFSQDYDAASYAFFLLDSTEVDGQTWYFVRIGATVDDKQGWITWDDYNILKDCAPFNAVTQANAVPVPSDGTLPLVPTIIPADVSTVPTALAVPAMPLYIYYVVQPGDTLLSILTHFNLDAGALPKVVFINHLPENPTLSVGTTLLIPAPTNNQPLICIVSDQQTVELRSLPSADAPVLMTLPSGSIFQIEDPTQRSDETWYLVTAQIDQTTISSVWVQSSAPLDCQRFTPDNPASALSVDLATSDVLQPIPTLVR